MSNSKQTDTEEDLRARILAAERLSHILLQGYSALRSYGVDFMSLREWKEASILDDARKLRPSDALKHIMSYLDRLSHAITAAVNRKTNIKVVQDNSDIFPPEK